MHVSWVGFGCERQRLTAGDEALLLYSTEAANRGHYEGGLILTWPRCFHP